MLLNQFRESARSFFGHSDTATEPAPFRFVPQTITEQVRHNPEDPRVTKMREQVLASMMNTNNYIQRQIGATEALNPNQNPLDKIKGIGGSIWDALTWPARTIGGAIKDVYTDTNDRIDKIFDTLTYVAYAAIAVGGIVLISSVRQALR